MKAAREAGEIVLLLATGLMWLVGMAVLGTVAILCGIFGGAAILIDRAVNYAKGR